MIETKLVKQDDSDSYATLFYKYNILGIYYYIKLFIIKSDFIMNSFIGRNLFIKNFFFFFLQ